MQSLSRTALTLAACSCLFAGCASEGSKGRTGISTTLTPSDFTKAPETPPATSLAARGTAGVTTTAAATPATPAAAAGPPTQTTDKAATPTVPLAPIPPRPGDSQATEFKMDAMVGQVNGKPIYASTIFKAIGEDTFERLGQEKPRLEFRQSAKELIESDLRSRISNQLLLAEAEKGLSEREHMGLADFLVRKREELLAQYGGGVLAVAEENLRKQRGHGLQEELESIRQRALTEKFLGEKVKPKIAIAKRDVERYFQDHIKEFQQDPSVALRLIVAPSERVAQQVEKELASKQAFEKVAQDFSAVRAEQGGLMGPYKTPLETFKELRWEEINAAVKGLKEGEHSQKIKIDLGYAWVKLEKLEGGARQELKDVYNDIESRMKTTRFGLLTRKYMAELLSKGNYTPVDQMSGALLEVAMTRFARAQ